MIVPILSLGGLSFVLAWALTWVVRGVALRVGFVDKPGHRKIHQKAKALGGGIAIFWAIALPMLGGLAFIRLEPPPRQPSVPAANSADSHLPAYWSGGRERTGLALGIIGAAFAIHVLGLFDDRKAMGPFIKLAIQLGIVSVLVIGFNLRALTALDHLGLGPLPSMLLTILWIAGITNAFNFLDNMDGLSAGVAAVSAAAFLVTALSIQQWFVAAALSLLLGSLLGFLCFNFAPATIFMGDSGSLLIGLLLGVLTVRTTYLLPGQDFGAGWYAVFAPVIVLAVPLYDLIVVSTIRLRNGRSPFVGDANHLSHRLVARGMSRRTAVLCIYLITAATAVAAVVLPHVQTKLGAILIFLQTLLILGVVALLEQHPLAAEPEAALHSNRATGAAEDNPSPAAV